MIGYASDEVARIGRLSDKKQSILVALGVRERDTFDICTEHNLLSPLYGLGLGRDGCWFCPNAGKREREMLKEQYPELVEKIKELIEMCSFDLHTFRCRNNWLQDYYNGEL